MRGETVCVCLGVDFGVVFDPFVFSADECLCPSMSGNATGYNGSRDV